MEVATPLPAAAAAATAASAATLRMATISATMIPASRVRDGVASNSHCHCPKFGGAASGSSVAHAYSARNGCKSASAAVMRQAGSNASSRDKRLRSGHDGVLYSGRSSHCFASQQHMVSHVTRDVSRLITFAQRYICSLNRVRRGFGVPMRPVHWSKLLAALRALRCCCRRNGDHMTVR